MENDDNDNRDSVLQIIPSKELKLIPLYVIITHIYERIIETTFEYKFTYAFNIDQLLNKYEFNTKLATSSNKAYIINEIKRLFPGIRITEIGEKYSAKSRYNSYWNACWEEELDDANADNELLKTDNVENDDDIALNQAIQESLKEVKKTERTNNRISIMGQKAEERIQKSCEKYKKLYK